MKTKVLVSWRCPVSGLVRWSAAALVLAASIGAPRSAPAQSSVIFETYTTPPWSSPGGAFTNLGPLDLPTNLVGTLWQFGPGTNAPYVTIPTDPAVPFQIIGWNPPPSYNVVAWHGGYFDTTMIYVDWGSPPANDAFADAIALSGSSLAATGENGNATAELNEPAHDGQAAAKSVWWTWTAPTDGPTEVAASVREDAPPFNLGTWNGGNPFRMGIYTGQEVTNLNLVPMLLVERAPTPPPLALNWVAWPNDVTPATSPEPSDPWTKHRFFASAGETYRIAVDVIPNGQAGSFNLRLQQGTLALVQPSVTTNLPIHQAIGLEFALVGTNAEIAWLEAFAGTNSLGVLTQPPFVFDFLPTRAGEEMISAVGTNVLGESVVALPVPLSFRQANDDLSTADVVPEGTTKGSFSVDARLATAEPGEPALSPGQPAAHSVWWQWTAPYSVRTFITVTSPGTRLAVYRGDSFSGFEQVLYQQTVGTPLVVPTRSLASPASGPRKDFYIEFSMFGLVMPPVDDLNPPPPPLPAPNTYTFLPEAGVTYSIVADAAGIVSWTLEQQTLEFYPATAQRGAVGVPIALEAICHEVDRPPVQVTFMIEELDWNSLPEPAKPLATFDDLPFQFNLVPSRPGAFHLWAVSTNRLGEVHQTPRTLLEVFAANDDFSRAATIPPSTRATNFSFSTRWASAEPGEPAHRTGPAQHSLWWAWTPSYSGSVRLKAVRDAQGVPLDVFAGSSLADLRSKADNERSACRPGLSGIVRMRVDAGRTCFIRVDDTQSEPLGLREEITLSIEPARNPLPGEVYFSLVTVRDIRGRSPRIAPLARVYLPDGRTPVVGGRYVAQLYIAPIGQKLAPAGAPQPFIDAGVVEVMPSLAGTFMPALVIATNTAASRPAWAQVRAWDSSFGSSYEAARANGGRVGSSPSVQIVMGSEEVGPALLRSVRSFVLRDPDR